jgi:hypothetical protein
MFNIRDFIFCFFLNINNDVLSFFIFKSKSVRNSKQINIKSWISNFFSSTMNDDKIFFKIIMLIFISNNFHFWIEKFKDLALKIKVWQYINSNDNIKKFKKKILFEINHFSVKNFNLQSITNDLMTNQTIFAAISHSRSAQWFHELTSS